jgi:peptide/nickel transport system ATP-binding protein
MALRPGLLLADEPTSALDASVTAGVLHAIKRAAESGTAVVFVSHDLAVLESLCSRVLKMEEGFIRQEQE